MSEVPLCRQDEHLHDPGARPLRQRCHARGQGDRASERERECVCVREREREREIERERGRVCACARERERVCERECASVLGRLLARAQQAYLVAPAQSVLERRKSEK